MGIPGINVTGGRPCQKEPTSQLGIWIQILLFKHEASHDCGVILYLPVVLK